MTSGANSILHRARLAALFSSAARLTSVLIAPMSNAYLRSFHGARADGSARSSGAQALRWLVICTASVAAAAVILGTAFQSLFGIGRWTIIAAGFFFLTERWRGFGLEMFDLLRRRRAGALFNLMWHCLTIGGLLLLVRGWSQTAGAALLAGAIAGVPAAIWSVRRLLPDMLPGEGRTPSALGTMIRTFGVPYAVLLSFQWLQTFADRYLLGAYLNLETVGQYTAAFQACGVPYMVFFMTVHWLVMPIAYHRAADLSNAAGLWSADRTLLAAVGAYLAGGVIMLGVYSVAGVWVVQILTQKDFALSSGTITIITLGRFIQCLGFLVQIFFAVHQRMYESMAIRILGGLATVPIVWWCVKGFGL
ncbi:MAG: hypothetical protein HZB38_05745, partial [Planctomycetes bacterium]|nr:hypothetical protein [Planctomycetota bacterium]